MNSKNCYHLYPPPTKLWEGNVSSHVCSFVVISHDALDLSTQDPPRTDPCP